MNTRENFSMRTAQEAIEPERLAMLKRVHDAICLEAAVEAATERHALAERLIAVSGIMDDEELLLTFARNALAEYRSLMK